MSERNQVAWLRLASRNLARTPDKRNSPQPSKIVWCGCTPDTDFEKGGRGTKVFCEFEFENTTRGQGAQGGSGFESADVRDRQKECVVAMVCVLVGREGRGLTRALNADVVHARH